MHGRLLNQSVYCILMRHSGQKQKKNDEWNHSNKEKRLIIRLGVVVNAFNLSSLDSETQRPPLQSQDYLAKLYLVFGLSLCLFFCKSLFIGQRKKYIWWDCEKSGRDLGGGIKWCRYFANQYTGSPKESN